MQCDGRTFTQTNGNIVSEKADRAVNRGPNTEQITINRNSFSELLGAKASNTVSRKKVGGLVCCPSTMTSELARLRMGHGQMSPGILFLSHFHPSWDCFHDVFRRIAPSHDALLTRLPQHLKARRGKLPSLYRSPPFLIQSIRVSHWTGLGHRPGGFKRTSRQCCRTSKSHEGRSLGGRVTS